MARSTCPELAVVAMVTITLFMPCIATIIIIVRERGATEAVAITPFIFPFAFLVGGLLHHALGIAGWGA